MTKISNNYKLARAAIDDISKINIYRLTSFIANHETPEKLIPYIKGEKYLLSSEAMINDHKCLPSDLDLYKILFNDRVDYTYEVGEYKTVYINPQEFTSITELVERFQSDDIPEHFSKPLKDFICPIVIPFKVKKEGHCTYDEWEKSAVKSCREINV